MEHLRLSGWVWGWSEGGLEELVEVDELDEAMVTEVVAGWEGAAWLGLDELSGAAWLFEGAG